MPFAAKPMLTEEQEKQKLQQQGSGVNISGNSTSFSTGIPGQEGGKSKTSSGNYANIQSYLDANKEQADGMGQKIASDVDQQAGTAQTKIAGLETKAPKVEAYDPNEVFSNVTKLSDDQKNAYRTQRTTGGYDGPQSIDQVEGYADTQKAAADASTKVKNTASETGQQQLLKDTYARPQYSAGENRLDQVLLQNSQGSKQALEAVNTKYKDLDNLFNTATTNVGNSINSANTQALSNKQNVLAGEQKQYDQLLNPIQQRAQQANIDNPVIADKIFQDIKDDSLSEETLQKLGLTAGTKLYDQDLKGYYAPTQTQVGIDNVATADERAKYKALSDLIQDPTRTQLTADGKAIDPFTFDKQRFEQENAAKAAEQARIFANTNIGGGSSFNHQGGVISGQADANVAEYLARGAAAVNATSNFGGGGGGAFFDWNTLSPTEAGFADGRSGATSSALANLEKFLNDQQYYRTIQKG